MNKDELKKVLKPLIKECIREVMFEEGGALSHVIKEVAAGLSEKTYLPEAKVKPPTPIKTNKNQLSKRKKQLLDAIGKDAYGGVNIFEGTTPMKAPVESGNSQGPLSNVDAHDPGVDISNLFGQKAFAISQKMMGKK